MAADLHAAEALEQRPVSLQPRQSRHLCEVWPTGKPCGLPAVERLVFCNPRCAGTGCLWVCARHLAEHRMEHLV